MFTISGGTCQCRSPLPLKFNTEVELEVPQHLRVGREVTFFFSSYIFGENTSTEKKTLGSLYLGTKIHQN
jgi:hypothetical protein